MTPGIIVGYLMVSGSVQAQIIPDGTLGNERSQVMPADAITDRIDGGAMRGVNLFHSFQDFNVGNLRVVNFVNPPGIENILTRVTGGNASRIDGTLGVLGNANLFLLNPNGVLFGPNARLNIGGSFLATTASSFQFPDGSEFSATNPQSAPLLTVNLPLGLQYGPSRTGAAIASTGNLTAGQNLTLNADRLNLQGQLQAGRDLTLQAQDTVQVRDSVTVPFVARSGGNMLIQGNQNVDILALNHLNQTPFVSGGNLSLISNGNVSGDAHFVSNGNFSILNLAGQPGSFVSLYDPIISSNNDVTFDAYRGVSLKVEAKGKITVNGDIVITGPDTGLNPPASTIGNSSVSSNSINNSSTINITSASGSVDASSLNSFLTLTSLPADGNVAEGSAFQTTFDGRNGDILQFDWNFVTTEPIATSSTFNDYAFINLTGGDVNGTIAANGPALTSGFNQLASAQSPNLTSTSPSTRETGVQTFSATLLSDASYNFSVGVVDVGDRNFDSRINITNARLIRRETETQPGLTEPLPLSDPDISILRNEPAVILRAGVLSLTNPLPAQNFYPVEPGSSISVPPNNTFTSSHVTQASEQTITLQSIGSPQNLNLQGVRVILDAPGKITINGNIDSSSNAVNGKAGQIDITSRSDIQIGFASKDSSQPDPPSPSAINASSEQGAGANINIISGGTLSIANRSVSTIGKAATGNITLQGRDVSLTDGTIIDASSAGDNPTGSVLITATEGRVSLDRSSVRTVIRNAVIPRDESDSKQNITIRGNEIELKNRSSLDANTFGRGNGGEILLESGGKVSITDGGGIRTNVNEKASGTGGKITIRSGSFELLGGSALEARTSGAGNAGDIEINVTGTTAQISGFDRFTGFPGGVFTSSEQENSGTGGKISINVLNGTLTVSNRAVISALTKSNQSGGSIEVNADRVEVLSGGQFIATTEGSGPAGSITITATTSTKISGSFDPAQLPGPYSPFLDPTQPYLSSRQNLPDGTFNTVSSPNVELSEIIGYKSATRCDPAPCDNTDRVANYYEFEVRSAGSIGIFDIDSTTDIDTELFLFNKTTGELVNSNDDAATSLGGQGSIRRFDSYIKHVFQAPGTYVLGLSRYNTQAESGSLIVTSTSGSSARLGTSNYTLQVSLEDPGSGNVSLPNQGNNSGVFTQSKSRSPSGIGGTITITSGTFTLKDGGTLNASTDGFANGGNINVTTGANSLIPVQGNSLLVNGGQIKTSIEPPVSRDLVGLPIVISGDIHLTAQTGSILLTNPSSIPQLENSTLVGASTAGLGRGGTVVIQSLGGGLVSVLNGARVETRTTGVGNGFNFGGNAGDIEINGPDIIISGSTQLNGQPVFSGLLASSDTAKSKEPGRILINRNTPGNSLVIENGAFLSTLNRSDLPDPDDLANIGLQPGSIQPGSIQVNVNHLRLQAGGQIITTAEGRGGAGSITINSPDVQISGTIPISIQPQQSVSGSGILPWQRGGQGIDFNALDHFSVEPNAAIDFSTTVPYVTIQGRGGAFDFYRFDNVSRGNRVVADIDNDLVTAGTRFDTELFLFNSTGKLLTRNDDSRPEGAERGSNDISGQGNRDSYLDFTFTAPGSYVLGIGQFASNPVPGRVDLTGSKPDAANGYTLQLSVDRRNNLNPNQSGNSGLFAQSTAANGVAGSITVNGGGTGQVIVQEGGQIAASAPFGRGGDITLRGLSTLQMRNGQIRASTQTGGAGNVTVDASDSITLDRASRLSVEAEQTGTTGNLTLTTHNLRVRDSEITVKSAGGPAGNLIITARDIRLDNGKLIADTGATPSLDGSTTPGGANIRIGGVRFLIMKNESLISASANNVATGGNVFISADYLIGLRPTGREGSDIRANADRGNAGRVTITGWTGARTYGVFGFRQGRQPTRYNDITASSQSGAAGVVDVNSLELDPTQGVGELLVQLTDPSRQIQSGCVAASQAGSRRFVAIGRGGMPPNPAQPLTTDAVLTATGQPLEQPEPQSAAAPHSPAPATATAHPPDEIVEASGWTIAPDGGILLTTAVPAPVSYQSPLQPPTCDDLVFPAP